MIKPLRLKRYANRRLYNQRDSNYVTLGEVTGMIREGERIEVVDAKTGEDVTAYTLTQILVEEAKGKNFLLPVSLLHTMIRYGDNVLAEFFDKYLELAIRSFATYKGTVDERFRKWMEMGMGMTGVTPGSFQEVLDQLRSFTPPGFRKGGKNKE